MRFTVGAAAVAGLLAMSPAPTVAQSSTPATSADILALWGQPSSRTATTAAGFVMFYPNVNAKPLLSTAVLLKHPGASAKNARIDVTFTIDSSNRCVGGNVALTGAEAKNPAFADVLASATATLQTWCHG